MSVNVRRSVQQDRQLVFDVLDNLPLGVIALDKNFKPMFVNETLAGLIGLPLKRVLEADSVDLSKWYIGNENDTKLLVRCMNGLSFTATSRLLNSAGESIPIRINGFPLYTKKSQIDGVVILCHDLRQQLFLERSFSEYRHILDSINAAVMAIDINGFITTCNENAASFWNKTSEQLIGAYLPDFYTEAGHKKSYLLQALEHDKSLSFPELWWECDGKEYLLSLECNPIKDSDGKTIGAVGVWRDITLQRIMELESNRAEKLAVVGELAAGTAHEIRNPLTSIRGFIQLLENRFPPDAAEQDYLKIMLGELDRANEIIKNFLLLAKPQHPKLQFQDLNYLLEELAKLVEAQALLTEVQLIRDFCQDMPFMVLETESIKQVFLNLIQNALQAMPNGGKLTISSEFIAGENQCVVRIIDTGVGIPRDVLRKIGHPFFTTKKGGTGMGLAVSYRIIENHKGQIEVNSKENEGTTFIVKLPVS